MWVWIPDWDAIASWLREYQAKTVVVEPATVYEPVTYTVVDDGISF